MFIQGHLTFCLDSNFLEYKNIEISLFGITGLNWNEFRPSEQFGKIIYIEVETLSSPKMVFKTPAQILREETAFSQNLALRFLLTPEQREELSLIIQNSGFHPTHSIRKYPRIPSLKFINSFPLYARVCSLSMKGSSSQISSKTSLQASLQAAAPSITFQVDNISPGGILISSENPYALDIRPQDKLQITLDPRGWFPSPVTFIGLVCRVFDDLNSETGNLTRRFGIKFFQMEEIQKKIYLNLLKDVIEQIQTDMKREK